MDEDTPTEGENTPQEVEFEGKVTDAATGESITVSGDATIARESAQEEPQATPISDAPSAQAREGSDGPNCLDCGSPLAGKRCVNSDCESAQAQWSQGGSRTTAKVAAAAAQDRPRAWASSGRVD